MKKNNSVVAVVFTLVVGGAVAFGCGGNSTFTVDTVGAICQDICACSRCTSNDLAACEDQGNNSSVAADEAGCSAEFQDVLACVSAHVTCEQNTAVTHGCEAVQEALDSCAAGLDPYQPSLCELAADALATKYAACGIRRPPMTSRSACSDALGRTLDCAASCYDAASCAYLQCDNGDMAACDTVSPDEAQAFADCIVACP
jgi:hypothetical protein